MISCSLSLCSSGRVRPDGDGGGEDGHNDGNVEESQHCLWQVEILQELQEETLSVLP